MRSGFFGVVGAPVPQGRSHPDQEEAKTQQGGQLVTVRGAITSEFLDNYYYARVCCCRSYHRFASAGLSVLVLAR